MKSWLPNDQLRNQNYQKVIIHDNFNAIRRYAKYIYETDRDKDLNLLIQNALLNFNGRFTVLFYDNIALISTCMGSAQTNALVEVLAKKECKAIIKIGTTSALHEDLEEGDIIIPYGALIDEGATYWREVKYFHDVGKFKNKNFAKSYLEKKKFVKCNSDLRDLLIKKTNAYIKKINENENDIIKLWTDKEISNQCVWSVDSYECFDSSPYLYSHCNKQDYTIQEFLTDSFEKINLIGVEMECAALFSSSKTLNIPAASLIIVSRSRERLLYNNVKSNQKKKFNIPEKIELRNIRRKEFVELHCFKIANSVLKDLS